MIKIRVQRTENKIVEIEVKGHAGYADAGKDLVCAGVSAINFGGLNAVAYYFNQDLSKFQVDVKEGNTVLKIIDTEEKRVQTVLETLVIQFKTIEETYSKYIKVMEQEVHAQ